MSDEQFDIIDPDELETELNAEKSVIKNIERTAEAMIILLNSLDNKDDAAKVHNIVLTLVDQEEIYLRLFHIYKETYSIQTRLATLLSQKSFEVKEKQVIQSRATEIVNEQVFSLQRDVFFKIVNAKEVADGDKDEDGPALLYPGIENEKNEIVRNIHSQTQQLRPSAVDICKSFKGIADEYVATEDNKSDDKTKYDTILQLYELEKKIKSEISEDINLVKLDESPYLDGMVESFEKLRKTYRLKTISLKDKKPYKVINYDLKIEILKKGAENCDKRIKPLKVLRNLSKSFPKLEKQMDMFAESYYQAKAVMKFLDEVNEEMSHIFKKYDLTSFTVISFLKYKLNGTSHMYESIHYYYASVQIESDIREALRKRFTTLSDKEFNEQLETDPHKKEVFTAVLEMHGYIAKMNESNYEIHKAFIEYKQNADLEVLRTVLNKQTAIINNLHLKVKTSYKKIQQIFFTFLGEDLGATEITSQLSYYLKLRRDLHSGAEVRKGFNNLLSTKRNVIEDYERGFLLRFGERVNKQKIQAMAHLKVKTDFQKEILLDVQKYPQVQGQFIYILKEFIKIQEDGEKSVKSDLFILRLVKREYFEELRDFKREDLPKVKQLLGKAELTEREIIVAFIAANITPQEIESFSRLLPGLPRNEFQLDSPYGRLLLDIKGMNKQVLQFKAASGSYILEKAFEKKERQKLISNICKFFQECMEPFFKRIDNEEKKINNMIYLEQRKFQKELNQVIRFWQYLIQEQINPGQGKRGRFRKYSKEEKRSMMKYISPEQLNTLEKQMDAGYDLFPESNLFLVEEFLMDIVSGLFKNFEEDLRIKAKFEDFEMRKKIRRRELQPSERRDLLKSLSFVPNIRKSIAKINKIKRRNTIHQFLDFWELLIDQKVPASDKRKKKQCPKIELNPHKEDAINYITVSQLQEVLTDLDLIQKVRDTRERVALLASGLPIIKIAISCVKVFKTEINESELKALTPQRREEMIHFCQHSELEKSIKIAIKTYKKTA